jgi:hypothetical protein
MPEALSFAFISMFIGYDFWHHILAELSGVAVTPCFSVNYGRKRCVWPFITLAAKGAVYCAFRGVRRKFTQVCLILM